MGILDFLNPPYNGYGPYNGGIMGGGLLGGGKSPYTDQMRYQAGMQGMGLLGGTLMAAGAPSTDPSHFGRTMMQGTSQLGPMMQQSLQSQLAMEDYMRQREQEEAAAQAWQDYLSNAEGYTPEQMGLLGAMDPSAGMELAAERVFDDPEAFMPNLETFSDGDEEVTGYFDPVEGFVEISRAPRWKPDTPAAPTPRSDLAQLKADLDAGFITPDQYESEVARITAADAADAPTPYSPVAKLTADFRNGYLTAEEYERQKLEELRQSETPNAEDFDSADKLRDELNALSKDFLGARDAYSRVQASAEDPSPAGDLALIFNYMKVLDPGSVVRESEFATAAASGSFGQQIQAAVNRVMSGERLSDEMRADFVDRAGRLYQAQENNYLQNADRYRTLAEQFDVDPSLVVMDYALPSGDTETPAGIPEGATQIGTLPNGTPVWEDAEGNRWVEE